ncbi:MAG: VanZ family protein [Casimicrobiaceae bacterium]
MRGPSNKPFYIATAGYLLFVIYGSLVPLDFRYRSAALAWQAFSEARYLQLGIGSRADWIANLLLYVPLAFLLRASLGAKASAAAQILCALLVFSACAALAVIVEFVQIFFPPRTVSLNDLIAEFLGAAGGLIVWTMAGKRLREWRHTLAAGGAQAVRLSVVAYLGAYLVLSLFPFDFLVSPAELSWKLASDRYALLLSDAVCASARGCVAKALAEIVAVVPLGILLGMAGLPPLGYGKALLLGFTLGAVIEAAQFLLASGVTTGLSLVTRALGVALGLWVFRHSSRRLLRWVPYARPTILLAFPLYIFALMVLNGWFSGERLSIEAGVARMSELNFLPFYYHYYTSETEAMASLLNHAAMYFPLGLAGWGWQLASPRQRNGAWVVGLAATTIAIVMETGKLFVNGKRPDPTDIFIAAVASAAAYGLARLATRWLSERPAPSLAEDAHRIVRRRAVQIVSERPAPSLAGDAGNSRPTAAVTQSSETLPAARRPPAQGTYSVAGLIRIILALLLLGLTGWAVWHYPLGSAWLGLALLLYVVVLRYWPMAWLLVLPALLPALDLAPWSGWFFFDEFDLFVAATLLVGLMRAPLEGPAPRMSALAVLLLGTLFLSYMISFMLGLFPLQPIDANSFSSYYSHYNALRLVKGVVWAVALLPLLRHSLAASAAVPQLLSMGMLLGLAAVVAVVLWERVAFVGLFNFSSDYRVTATFSGMHTGGAFIEAYLVSALPFAAFLILRASHGLVRVAAAVVFCLGGYALMVTYSRAGYVGFALAMGIFCAAIALHAWRGQTRNWAGIAGPAVLLVAVAAAALPVLEGSYMKSRFSGTQRDLGIRSAHWTDALSMMDPGYATSLFGMGLGRYPESYFWRNSEGVVPATYRFESEGSNRYLRLGAGDSLYLNQLVRVRPGQNYLLSFDARSQARSAALTVPVCEKWMLYSFRCQWLTTSLGGGDGNWRHYETKFNSGELADGKWYARRSVMLSLYNPQAQSVVDVDNVKLIDETGGNLIANGDFSLGNARWLFSTDNHLPWHIKNMWVQLIFEQGWLGLFATLGVMLYSWVLLAKKTWDQDLFAATILAAISGFLLIGLFDSLFDAPRLSLLFFLLVFLGIHRAKPLEQRERPSAPRQSESANAGTPFRAT